MKSPPWLNMRSTGADVQDEQKTLSKSGFREMNCLLVLTRCRSLAASVLSCIRSTCARYDVTRFVSGRVLSVDVVGFWYEANREVLGALAGGGPDPPSSELLALFAAGAGVAKLGKWKSLENSQDFVVRTKTKANTFLSRPRPRLWVSRPRLYCLSSRRLETKTLVSRTTSLLFSDSPLVPALSWLPAATHSQSEYSCACL